MTILLINALRGKKLDKNYHILSMLKEQKMQQESTWRSGLVWLPIDSLSLIIESNMDSASFNPPFPPPPQRGGFLGVLTRVLSSSALPVLVSSNRII
jgi:hypothetical protein